MTVSTDAARWDDIKHVIKTHQSFVIISHISPDGDAIGSQMGLYYLLKRLDKTVYSINQDETPANLRFLDPDQRIQTFDEAVHGQILKATEVIIVVDTNSWDRTGTVGEFAAGLNPVSICIDHHIKVEPFTTHRIVDTETCAAAELVFSLIKAMDVGLDDDLARSIYTGLLTDTGSFRFPRTTAYTHVMLAELLRFGVQPDKIYQEVYEMNSRAAFRLLGRSLNELQTDCNGQLAWLVVTQNMLKETETSEDDTEGFVNYTMRLKGVKVGILFRESDGDVKISLRSKGTYNVSAVARSLGGGGHVNASGIRMEYGIDEAVQAVLNKCREDLFGEDAPN